MPSFSCKAFDAQARAVWSIVLQMDKAAPLSGAGH